MIFHPSVTGCKIMQHSSVYIAEEDKVFQRRLSSALKQNGFDVNVFDSGYPLVAMMDNWPDIFLVDIELPGINGLEVCKWLKSHESSSHIPVIFLSGDPCLKILAASAHADDYIEKPVAISKVINRIRECLVNEVEFT
jgi:DNA-binding response OmpR family regulator